MTPNRPPEALVIRGERVMTETGIRAASIHVAGGRITRLGIWDDNPPDVPLVDAGNAVVMPGIVDTHVHVNEPGRTEWEGFETVTRAAAAGGVTTLLDMPLNSIPATTTVAALEAKRSAAHGKTRINVEYIGGVVPGNVDQIEPLAAAGVRAFKCFLTPSGVDEFENVDEDDLRIAFPALARTGLPLMVHAEDPRLILHGPAGGSRAYSSYVTSRPPAAEESAIEMLVRLMDGTPTRLHVVHLSSARSLAITRAARARGLPLTVETCPHYLTFASDEVPDGATEFKCAPPIRDRAERDALWQGLVAGDIDLIASDHSPCPLSMKETEGDFFAAWGGIASIQLSLAAVWTGARARGISLQQVSRWMSASTARLAGLGDRKGTIAPSYDADLVFFDPDTRFVVDPAKLAHRNKVTPYAGRELFGTVRAAYLAGSRVEGRG